MDSIKDSPGGPLSGGRNLGGPGPLVLYHEVKICHPSHAPCLRCHCGPSRLILEAIMVYRCVTCHTVNATAAA